MSASAIVDGLTTALEPEIKIAQSLAPQATSILGKTLSMPIIMFGIFFAFLAVFIMLFNSTGGIVLLLLAFGILGYGLYNLNK